MDQMLNARPKIINSKAGTTQGKAGIQENGRPDTQTISAGIPATKTKKPRM